MAGSESGDVYATQAANLRDTAKWMAVGYGAVAAAVVAGAPFSAISGLGLERLIIVVVAAFLAMLCFLVALNDIVTFLIGNPRFASELDDADKAYIDAHAADMLPARFNTYAAFDAERLQARQAVRTAADQIAVAVQANPPNAALIQGLQESFKAASDVVDGFESARNGLVSEAHLRLLHQKLNDMRRSLAVLTVAGAVLLFIAIWAAKPEKPSGESLYVENAGSHAADVSRPAAVTSVIKTAARA
jgi:ABC-type anion transport system duplicated permease subunit